jgi:HlyD family secretion protein
MVAMAIVAVPLLLDSGRRGGVAQNTGSAPGPLISRGYTGAPAGTAVVAGDPEGGEILVDLKIVNGQKVKRDEIIAVLNNFATADVAVRQAEARLTKLERLRETMISGFRTTQIAVQEAIVESTTEQAKLKALELQRSSLPPDQKELHNSIWRQSVEREQARLRVQKEGLATELAQIDKDIGISKAWQDSDRMRREAALARSPVDGVVVEIFTRQGERTSHRGIAKIVDLSQLRIFADVDEVHIARLTPGSRVEFTLRGDPTVHTGTVVRTPFLVQRSKMSEADFGTQATRLAEVEIKPDDLTDFPLMLGREARVVFH